MESLSRKRLLDFDKGRHFASEPHLRIQVLSVSPTETGQPADLFSAYHGELLVLCVKGRCRVETKESGIDLAELDQVLLLDGEPFRLVGIEGEQAVVELIWTPGPNPCRACWEADNKFFAGEVHR
jgi:hypothetical protein